MHQLGQSLHRLVVNVEVDTRIFIGNACHGLADQFGQLTELVVFENGLQCRTVCLIRSIPATVRRLTLTAVNGLLVRLRESVVPDQTQFPVPTVVSIRHPALIPEKRLKIGLKIADETIYREPRHEGYICPLGIHESC